MEKGTASTDAKGASRASRVAPIHAPLALTQFRRMWLASLLSNLGLQVLGVGAAWAMTQLTTAAGMIALVQSAVMLPVMLLAVMAGAIADMYDRRRVGLAAVSISLLGSVLLSLVAVAGLLDPWILLGCCILIGTGTALLWPAWAAAVNEQVPTEIMPQAVALNSISFNIARSIGPAIGGIVVAAASAVAAFSTNAVLCIPLLLVFLLWNREQQPSRLPPERLFRAISSGLRYVMHSPPIRTVLTRTFAMSLAGGSILALMPVVARDMLQGGPLVFGATVGAFGVGAVLTALNMSRIRQLYSSDRLLLVAPLVSATMIAVVGVSHSMPLTIACLVVIGACWMLGMTLFNVAIQISVPRWVAGRTLASFQTSTAGGVAIGAWLWGHTAELYSLTSALLLAAVAMALTALLAKWMPMPADGIGNPEPVELDMPEVALALTGRSGPIVVEIEYRVDPAEARAFYGIMQQVQQLRHRNGGYDWSIARDINDPEQWTERYHCPTWHDYLRLRSRYTAENLALLERCQAFHKGPEPIKFRRRLERPFGSVRWRDDAPDRGAEVLPIVTPVGNS